MNENLLQEARYFVRVSAQYIRTSMLCKYKKFLHNTKCPILPSFSKTKIYWSPLYSYDIHEQKCLSAIRSWWKMKYNEVNIVNIPEKRKRNFSTQLAENDPPNRFRRITLIRNMCFNGVIMNSRGLSRN